MSLGVYINYDGVVQVSFAQYVNPIIHASLHSEAPDTKPPFLLITIEALNPLLFFTSSSFLAFLAVLRNMQLSMLSFCFLFSLEFNDCLN